MNSSRGSVHCIGVMTLEMSSQGRRMRPPICARLGGWSELVETGFDVEPLALPFQGVMLPLCIILWIVELVDLLMQGIRKSSSK